MKQPPPMPSWRVFGAPSRYVQGPGVIDRLGGLLVKGQLNAAVLMDAALFEQLSTRVLRTLAESDVDATVITVNGEVTARQIASYADQAKVLAPSIIVAVGGGKTLDTAKGVSLELSVPIVTVPTIASNDGPTSRLIALYDDQHLLIATPQMALNPQLVVVDTELIAYAPSHFLRAGIGDALSKRFEADACVRSGGVTPNGTRPLAIASIVADACYRILRRDAARALADVERHVVSPAIESVVEAVILLSGMAFENGGLSLAHSMTRGLMSVSGAKDRLHGTQVAYGLLVQLQHEGEKESLDDLLELFTEIGLPKNLGDLSTTASSENVRAIVGATLNAPHMANCDPRPTSDSIVAAIDALEAA